jgi:AraC-like DNA-binding protein
MPTSARIANVPGAVVAYAHFTGELAAPQILDDYALHFAEEGNCDVRVRGTTVRLTSGDLQWRLPGELRIVQRRYSLATARRSLIVSSKVLEETLVGMGYEASALRVIRAESFRDRRVLSALMGLSQCVDNHDSSLAQESAYCALVESLCRVVPHAAGGDEKVPWPSHRAVSFVKEYLHAYYAKDTSLAELAALAGIDKYHLLRAFKRDVGLPPHRYRTHVRIAHSRRLITEGVSLVDVALEVGFASQSRFHDSFRAIVGVSPGRYRKQLAR